MIYLIVYSIQYHHKLILKFKWGTRFKILGTHKGIIYDNIKLRITNLSYTTGRSIMHFYIITQPLPPPHMVPKMYLADGLSLQEKA